MANCANASRKDSILEEIYSLSAKVGESIKTGYNETKKAEVSALVAKGGLSHEGQYSLLQEDKLITAFSNFNSQSKDLNSKHVVVLDNVETIFKNNSLMSELSDIIILLDDERYEKYNIKILIVGVPNGVMQYFLAAKNPASVGNRIEEIRRVTGLSSTQTRDLVKHGLTIQLKIDISPGQMKGMAKHIFSITLGVPQRIHEYCECLAYNIEDNDWVYEKKLLDSSDQQWLIKGLRECYVKLSSALNSDVTVDGRRNQVIYSLGINTSHEINT